MSAADAMIPLLKTVPYLAGLRSDVLRTIAAGSRSKSFRAGEVVFTEGDPCQHLHVLESGRVKFYRTSPEGREQVMRVFDRQGDTFCIPSAFRAGTYIVSARAVTEVRLHLLDVDTLNRLAGEQPAVALKLIATAGEHMMHLVSLAEDLSLKTATARLAKHLYELAVADGATTGREVRLSRERLPEEELASMLGTVRVHVSRSLMNLVRAGAIDLHRSFIRIPDLTALRQIAEGK